MDSHTTQTTSPKVTIPTASNPRTLYPMPDKYWEKDDEMAIEAIEELLAERLQAPQNN